MEVRFMAKVEVHENGCWMWRGAKDRKGYGMFSVGKGRKPDGTRRNSMRLAHRVSYELFKGQIPEHDSHHGMCVLHMCDTPGCVNPDHLFLGTNTDNVHDMDEKGRRVNVPNRGSKHGNAVLDEAKVKEIMVKLKSRYPTQREIAKMYGVSYATINHIKTGRLWAHVTGVKREKD